MILVLGSLHRDVLVEAPRLPALDETLMGTRVSWRFGGKGGLQAVAAARCGARVAFAGAVGSDEAGPALLAALDAAGIDRSRVAVVNGSSGMSVAIDTPDGYGAVVVSGANLRTSVPDIPGAVSTVLLQNEVPEAANLELARALPRGATLILNAAPARTVPDALRARVDLLVVNRVEAAAMGGLDVLRAGGTVIETLGAEGCRLGTPDGVAALPAPRVEAVSSHGAGDAFCGALAAAHDRGLPLEAAVAAAQDYAARIVAAPYEARASVAPPPMR